MQSLDYKYPKHIICSNPIISTVLGKVIKSHVVLRDKYSTTLF